MRKSQQAFTLIELLVTICVVGILVFIALPNFQKFIANSKALGVADEFTGALNFARSEALKRGRAVTLCPMNSAIVGGVEVISCGSDWLKGWAVVIDTAATETTKPPVVADQTAVLRRWEKRDDTLNVSMLPAVRQFIRFNGLGALARVEGTASAVTKLQVAKCSGLNVKTITVSLSGMLTTSSSQCP